MTAGKPAVLLVGDTLNLGGTEGQFVEVACGLARSGWAVHASCLRAEGPLRARLEAAGVRVWSCGRGSFRSPRVLSSVWGLARYLRTHRIRLVHSFDFYSNLVGVPAARLARVGAMIASQRDLGDLRPRYQARVHEVALRFADYVLANSAAAAEQLKRQWRRADGRVVAIPNGVDVARFSPAPRAMPRRLGQVTVGTLANLRPEKGLEDLIRAVAIVRERYPHVRLVVWGEGPLRPQLECLSRTLAPDGVAELPGLTTEPESALRALDIYVLPSTSESCSNALLEAMATGLPVVATRVGGNQALVLDQETGLLVPPADAPSLARAIIRLLEDPALAARLAAAGRDRVVAEFSVARLVSRVEALYDRALASGHSERLARRILRRHARRYGAPGSVRGEVERVLFLCYGNLCRSPFAEEVAKAKLNGYGIESAGFAWVEDRQPPETVVRAARSMGIDLANRSSTRVTGRHVRDADLILVMDPDTYECLAEAFPSAVPRATLLGLFAPEPVVAIEDPYRMTETKAAQVLEQIYTAVEGLAAWLSGNGRGACQPSVPGRLAAPALDAGRGQQ